MIVNGYSQHSEPIDANEMMREIVRLSARYEVTDEEEEKKGEMLSLNGLERDHIDQIMHQLQTSNR